MHHPFLACRADQEKLKEIWLKTEQGTFTLRLEPWRRKVDFMIECLMVNAYMKSFT
jgi:hypothetical protein